MIGRVLAAVKQAPEAPRIEDPKLRDELYATYRNHVLYGSLVAYALFYFCRKNLSIAKPLMSQDLGYTNTQLGELDSWLYITYGVFKFLSGLVADRSNPRVFLVAGLIASAIVNIAFGLGASLGAPSVILPVLVSLWAVNGVVQSTGAPASAKLIAVWFSMSERGTKTGIWNISHQGGGGLVLIVAGLFATWWGWQGAMMGPAVIALIGAILVARFIHDRPEAMGLPPIEEHRQDKPSGMDADASVPFGQLLMARVLLNPRVWLVALASACTYVARYGALDWSAKYLKEERGLVIGDAAVRTSLLELAGIPGALLCGWISDKLGARRAPVVMVSLLFLALCTWSLYRIPQDQTWMITPLLGLMGFFTYGPQMLLAGVAPVDSSSKRTAAAAVGFTGLMSYAGATAQSRISGSLVDQYKSWEPAINFWALAALAGAVLCIPMWALTPVRKGDKALAH